MGNNTLFHCGRVVMKTTKFWKTAPFMGIGYLVYIWLVCLESIKLHRTNVNVHTSTKMHLALGLLLIKENIPTNLVMRAWIINYIYVKRKGVGYNYHSMPWPLWWCSWETITAIEKKDESTYKRCKVTTIYTSVCISKTGIILNLQKFRDTFSTTSPPLM